MMDFRDLRLPVLLVALCVGGLGALVGASIYLAQAPYRVGLMQEAALQRGVMLGLAALTVLTVATLVAVLAMARRGASAGLDAALLTLAMLSVAALALGVLLWWGEAGGYFPLLLKKNASAAELLGSVLYTATTLQTVALSIVALQSVVSLRRRQHARPA